MSIHIDRCVCHDRPFRELLPLARQAQVTSVEELCARFDAGQGCGLCHPYLRAMLSSGQVVFTEVLGE